MLRRGEAVRGHVAAAAAVLLQTEEIPLRSDEDVGSLHAAGVERERAGDRGTYCSARCLLFS